MPSLISCTNLGMQTSLIKSCSALDNASILRPWAFNWEEKQRPGASKILAHPPKAQPPAAQAHPGQPENNGVTIHSSLPGLNENA